jgi:FtsP/CotA-like multicopper oxidase with cupredoxin domain
MPVDRRTFLKLGGLAAVAGGVAACAPSPGEAGAPKQDQAAPQGKADYTIRIGTGLVELAPDHIIATTLYNGQCPGPLLRLKEGQPVTVDIVNATDTPEQLHWHGQYVPVDVDGVAEEGTPYIPPHAQRRIRFTPGPPGVRFYHTHIYAGPNLGAGQYTGQAGIVYIEPHHEPGAYDREVFLMLKEFDPSFSRGGDVPLDFLRPADVDATLKATGDAAMKASLAKGMPHGYEVGYDSFCINGRMLGHGEPIRVKSGERVLLHIVNGSATEIRSLALPGHTFQVVALDGFPVAAPREVPVLWIGTGERVSAIVKMANPGVWVLGDLGDDDRDRGMGIVVEYANATGKPRWTAPAQSIWDYTTFGGTTPPPEPDQTFEMIYRKDDAAINGFNRWLINDVAFSMDQPTPMFQLEHGRRYRLHMRNATDDIHPIHLHRHSFELTRVAGRATSGVIKDVAMLGGYQEMDVDFTANATGLSLFHCHMQLHMDYGFMALFDCK